eukprot:TRINITY_DN8464_c0_g1_i2.p2 TRINITY_DN8464_c0_g1~~TRINITY_DN8464_c0_g1_i2.p2  ORF type:complete len:212 (-),score=54.10 TRINITY_DN8464_c0_g1_i2:690-1325(-)
MNSLIPTKATVAQSLGSGWAKFASAVLPQTAPAPWDVLPPNLVQYKERIKQQILVLSKDKWNFLQKPPGADLSGFSFSLAEARPIIRTLTSIDSYLSSFHYFLVPKQVSEETFWFNYFAHIYVIMQLFISESSSQQEPELIERKKSELEIYIEDCGENLELSQEEKEMLLNIGRESGSTIEAFTATAEADDDEFDFREFDLQAQIQEAMRE